MQFLCIQDYVLQTKNKNLQSVFFGKRLFEYKLRFAVEKENKKKFWGDFNFTWKNFCRHQKTLVIQF